MSDILTGKRRFRKGFGGKVVLQVEIAREIYRGYYQINAEKYIFWRDAMFEDITEMKNDTN